MTIRESLADYIGEGAEGTTIGEVLATGLDAEGTTIGEIVESAAESKGESKNES